MGSVQARPITSRSAASAVALRLTTARYYHAVRAASIQARASIRTRSCCSRCPRSFQGRRFGRGEAGLRGHLANGEEEMTASSAYVPPDPADDVQIKAALALLRGEPIETGIDSAARTRETETVPN